jgi:hypothetical protein
MKLPRIDEIKNWHCRETAAYILLDRNFFRFLRTLKNQSSWAFRPPFSLAMVFRPVETRGWEANGYFRKQPNAKIRWGLKPRYLNLLRPPANG